MSRVVILQTNYIPWKGYFHQLSQSDIFISFDNVQHTKNDWRNRNKIKTANGLKWLTIPVSADISHMNKRVSQVEVADSKWAQSHLSTIKQNYAGAPFFKEIMPLLESTYSSVLNYDLLTDINHFFIKAVCNYLEINTIIAKASDIIPLEKLDSYSPTQRLVELCKIKKATQYITGPAANAYLEVELFKKDGIEIIYPDYSIYPEYSQLHGEFTHQVSIIDMLFMLGKNARKKFDFTL